MPLTRANLVDPPQPAANFFSATDVAAILRERGWLNEQTAAASEWLSHAAVLLSPHAENRNALGDLLKLVFEYDARAILSERSSQEVLLREGTREVIRALASEILSSGRIDSDRLKEIVTAIKSKLPYRSREIFHPLRVAVAGRVGGGELDRVILLLDGAAAAEGLAPVKSVRARMLEFCSAID